MQTNGACDYSGYVGSCIHRNWIILPPQAHDICASNKKPKMHRNLALQCSDRINVTEEFASDPQSFKRWINSNEKGRPHEATFLFNALKIPYGCTTNRSVYRLSPAVMFTRYMPAAI
jgi:hypothetical protein